LWAAAPVAGVRPPPPHPFLPLAAAAVTHRFRVVTKTRLFFFLLKCAQPFFVKIFLISSAGVSSSGHGRSACARHTKKPFSMRNCNARSFQCLISTMMVVLESRTILRRRMMMTELVIAARYALMQ
jgi:hypothetical protein